MPGTLYAEAYLAFIAKLREARLRLGVTQASLADRLGKPQSFVSKTERGERRLDVVEFVDWATALGQDPEEFLKSLRA